MERFICLQSICIQGQGSGLSECGNVVKDKNEIIKLWLNYIRQPDVGENTPDRVMTNVETLCKIRTFVDSSRREIIWQLAQTRFVTVGWSEQLLLDIRKSWSWENIFYKISSLCICFKRLCYIVGDIHKHEN